MQQGKTDQVLVVAFEATDAYDALSRPAQRLVRFYARESVANGIAHVSRDEAEQALGMSPMTLSTAFKELRAAGFVSQMKYREVAVNQRMIAARRRARAVGEAYEATFLMRVLAYADTFRRKVEAGRASFHGRQAKPEEA